MHTHCCKQMSSALIHTLEHPKFNPKINRIFWGGVPMFILGLAELKLGLHPRVFHSLTPLPHVVKHVFSK